MDIPSLVAAINERKGSTYQLVGRLAGGYSEHGAYELRSGDEPRAVLKARPARRSAERLAATAAVLERAREAGWPMPRWLAFGLIPGQAEYVVIEMIAGAREFRLEESQLGTILQANRVQADLWPRIDADWSDYVWRVVFADERGMASQLGARPETKALCDRLARANERARGIHLPTSDLVHGDFTTVNMLVGSDGRPWLIDAEFAGKGTRAYDLATLLFETSVGKGPYLAAARWDEIRDECDALVGRAGLFVCVAARLFDLLDFGVGHWPDELPEMATQCDAFLDRIEVAR